MSDFEDLDTPKKALRGWYVVSKKNGVHYLHDDRRMHIGTADKFSLSTGYFPTEDSAHACAQHYYKYHGKKYPHTTIEDSQNVNDGSQQMNFG